MYIIFAKKSDGYGDPRYSTVRKDTIQEAATAYAQMLREGWDELILAQELHPTSSITVNVAGNQVTVPFVDAAD